MTASLWTMVLAAALSAETDPALAAPPVNLAPGREYADNTRIFQGIPGIERAANGRLWALWYAGGADEPGEGPGNYVVLVTSGDDGRTWSPPKLVIDPPGPVRAYDPCLWHDPQGRLWLFWAQSYQWWDGRSGVWSIVTENSGDETPRWSAPRRLADGIMMNKPTVLSSGEWLMPAAVWQREADAAIPRERRHDLGRQRGANVIVSKDRGATWDFLGQATVPQRVFDEHMIVERRDGSLWMLVRAAYGIGESLSTDRGKTWSAGRKSPIPHVNSRFFVRRLNSGRLLLIAHEPPDKKTRSHLTARLSDDDGATWRGGLVIDQRSGVSYPDGVQAPDGTIYIIYDYSRTGEKQIFMATFTEEDVARGQWLSAKARQRVLVNQATGRAEGKRRTGTQHPWQKITVPGIAEAARHFETPPPQHSLTMWWFWNGDMTPSNIRRDLTEMRATGIRSVMLWPYNGLVNLEYLSPAWFDRVKLAVQEAKKLDVRVWLMDEGCYPSGFVGGNVTRLRPQQRMQVLEARANARGQIEVKPEYRTPATRYIHQPGFSKDGTYSLFDALDPAATRDFLNDVHEQYKKAIGDEFGRTVLGFMGDEPSFPGVPFTSRIYDEFQRRKGYDVRPYRPRLFAKDPTDEDRRIRADYWDVWTVLYRDSYFQPQADWCAREGLEFLMHLCGEENMPTLVALNGDYFRCLRPVQVPGVDAIWRQIWPDKVADYAKLASSAAHLWGRPRSFSEGYAVYGRGLSVEQAKWVLDHHLVRGINLFQAMSYLSSRETFRPYFCPPDLNLSPQWPHFAQLFAYANRMSYLLSVGAPAASIAVYYPTTSAWLGDYSPDKAGLAVARQLLECHRDFDFVDDDSLHAVLKVDSGTLVNCSGQRYRAVVVPPLKVISEEALRQLERFAASGGRVVFLEKLPELVVARSYLHASKGPTELRWAAIEPKAELSQATLSRLPEPDCVLESPSGVAACASVKYLHRRLAGADLYFLFNEASQAVALTAGLEGQGLPQIWDAVTGRRARAEGSSCHDKHVRLRMRLEPYETKTIVLAGKADPPKEAAWPNQSIAEVQRLEGDWALTLRGKRLGGALKSWSEYGESGYSGTVRYRKEFTVADAAAAHGKALHLDLGDVKYSAQVRLNGRDLGVRAWRPFRWAVGDAIRSGANVVEVEVTNTAANELAGSPERLKEIESQGWLKNSYSRTYLPFDAEMVSSGLLGPVRLVRLVPADN